MYEIPDPEDNTSFMMNMKAKLTSIVETAVTLPMVVEPSWVDMKAEEVPHEWLKPFRAEWDSAQHSTSQDRVRGEGDPKELDPQGAHRGSS